MSVWNDIITVQVQSNRQHFSITVEDLMAEIQPAD